MKTYTEDAVRELVFANCGAHATARDKYIFREALRSLVRLAKAEQMLEVRASIKKLTLLPRAHVPH